jgi:NADPH-dependent glutamate synthase beta subunit-like oxidoreductase
VVVIGGGNVAIDVARTAAREGIDQVAVSTTMDAARAARRLGSREVHVICLEAREQMPAHGYEVDEAEQEGIIFHPSTGPSRVLGVGGKVTGLQTMHCASVFDANGRFNPRLTPGSEAVITADSIILSVGQVSDLSFLKAADGIETTPRHDQSRSADPGDYGAGRICGG